MKAYLIDPQNESVTEVEYDGIDDIRDHLQCSWFDAAYLPNGEAIYADDEGLMTGTTAQLGSRMFFWPKGAPQPYAGRGLWVGPVDRKGNTTEPTTPIEDVRAGMRFMDYLTLSLMSELGILV